MKNIITIFLTIFAISISCGQVPSVNIDYIQQLEYLSKDTLPVDIQRLSSNINTSYSEYNARLYADSTFFFTSLRPETSNDYENLFEEFWSAKIYASHATISGYSTPKALPSTINNAKHYNSNFSFNNEKTKLYYSRCLRAETKSDLKCEIWRSEYRHGQWTKSQRLSRKINLPGTNTTQPHLVEYDDCDLLFFVSDRANGYGGLDIWYSIYKDNRFCDPINLGSLINTPANEVTPFYDIDRQTLYFSSDRPQTIGGYDIFRSQGAFSIWESPDNIGVPFNSPQNDLYFSVNTFAPGTGFFSSNRPVNENDTCCHDIYQYKWRTDKTDTSALKNQDTTENLITNEEKIKRLLPLTLYFHNDEPNPRSWDTTTTLNYRTTLSDYLQLKATYEAEYSKGLKGEEREGAVQQIERFFSDSLEQGFRKLEQFSELLTEELEAGKKIEFTICGFASPLHKEEYNMRLSSRRISSILNYLNEYGNGIFNAHLKDQSLVIHAEPKGKSLAKKYVSDNINDQRNSVYSIAASLERRIQITDYKSIK